MTFLLDNQGFREPSTFSEFFPRMASETGPGWYVFGRNRHFYGGDYIKLCARPDVRARRYRHYNGPVRRGWRTKAEAQEVADWLNRAVWV